MTTPETVTDQLWYEAGDPLLGLSVEDPTNEYFIVDVSVMLSETVMGTIHLENEIDRLSLRMAYVGHDYATLPPMLHKNASEETQGVQHLEFKEKQVEAFFNFLLKSVPFRFENDWNPWTTIILEGIVDEDEDDVLIKPRLQCTFVTYGKDPEGERVVSKTSEMYLPFTPENRRAILQAISNELTEQRQLAEGPIELLRRKVRELLTRSKVSSKNIIRQTRQEPTYVNWELSLISEVSSRTSQFLSKMRSNNPDAELFHLAELASSLILEASRHRCVTKDSTRRLGMFYGSPFHGPNYMLEEDAIDAPQVSLIIRDDNQQWMYIELDKPRMQDWLSIAFTENGEFNIKKGPSLPTSLTDEEIITAVQEEIRRALAQTYWNSNYFQSLDRP